jgi:ubiquinone/menaquinone biosynthesis C-methylase UbiE
MKQVIDYFAGKQVNKILDVGTGTGDFVKVLKNVFPVAEITGVDPLEESLEEAKRSYPDVHFQKMTGEKLVFENSQFDLVSISMALHHLPDIQAAFGEMKRVLKPGGWIIVNELVSDGLNPAQEVHKLFHHFRSNIDRMLGEHHREAFTRDEIPAIIQKAGIKIELQFMDDQGNPDSPENYSLRYKSMATHLERINDREEYQLLKPQLEIFRNKLEEHGFQPSPRMVIVGRAQ